MGVKKLNLSPSPTPPTKGGVVRLRASFGKGGRRDYFSFQISVYLFTHLPINLLTYLLTYDGIIM